MRAVWWSVLVACGSPSARGLDAALARDARVIDGAVLDGAGIDGAGIDSSGIDSAGIDSAMIDSAMIDGAVRPDATLPDAFVVDAALPDAVVVDAATGAVVHITGIADQLAGARVADLTDGTTTIADANGNFAFDVPSGTRLVMRATATDATHLPMLRGVVAQAGLRTRHFNLVTTAQLSAMSALGVAFDPAKAIVQLDFRHAQSGGYGARLTQSGATVAPGFGVADSGGDYVLATTTQDAFNTTLLLANLPPGDTRFSPVLPPSATLPCQRRDADPLPLEAGSVTWVDFECGTDTTP